MIATLAVGTTGLGTGADGCDAQTIITSPVPVTTAIRTIRLGTILPLPMSS
jgi:hypothetical protein